MKIIVLLAAALALSACVEPKPAQVQADPVGRYQMLSVRVGHAEAEQPAVVVLDTSDGRITLCRAGLVGMDCNLGTQSFR